MTYTKAFFDLQLQFADKVSVLSGLPLARALLEYTNLYIRFGLGRAFDPAHPTWQEYLGGLQNTKDIPEWTYRFYLTRPDAMAAPSVVATVGCFSYAQWVASVSASTFRMPRRMGILHSAANASVGD